ncbi:DUF7146 domain-containing protein [Lichenihabitans psoromatis]|uniref:DUF7146 domain-containing protein n=1 Tax=Lichenihabitans psoromatis TaxID=2528642 RepID=UPI0010382E4A|nr:CHC2 zinc finger domain-containing protein [Lichenihabitans psoromatis]
MTSRDRAFDEWVARGRAVRVVEVLQRSGHFGRLRKAGHELIGPCPICCQGVDRYSVNPAKNVWNCRKCGKGGDAIALVCEVEAVEFLRAVEILTNEPPPGGSTEENEAERLARHARQTAIAEQAGRDQAAKEAESDRYRENERRRMFERWQQASRVEGTPVERYLRLRGVTAPAEAHLRYLPNYALWDGPPPHGTILHRGPAMMAAIVGREGRFSAGHVTWIDLSEPNGKAKVPDPKTGEFIDAKKVRGSKRGGSILLARPERNATTLILGEGIETVLSVREALIEAGSDLINVAEFRAGVDLDNMAGKADGKVPHPTDTMIDKAGRVRRVMVPGPTPNPADISAVIAIGATIDTIVLLGDGDSEPFFTRLAMQRAASRFAAAYPWLRVGLAMAPEGQDFNDLWRGSVPLLEGCTA